MLLPGRVCMLWCLLRAHTNVRFFLGRMSSNNELHLDIDPCDLDEEQKAAVKIAAMEAKYEKEIADMKAKLDHMALEKTTEA